MPKWLMQITLLAEPNSDGTASTSNFNLHEQVEADNVVTAIKLGSNTMLRTLALTGLVAQEPPVVLPTV
jgi:hypothetical protein